MKNIQSNKHPAPNLQAPTSKVVVRRSHWMLDIAGRPSFGCWVLDVSRFHLCFCLLALLATAACAFAQSNGVPGPEDYASFSRFITDRNIFDPTRQPHNYSSTRRSYTRTPRRSFGTPGIQLVGTMSYEKGMFAFFSGNSTDLSKVLQSGGKIVGYTITAITVDSVGLESADKKEQLELKIGDGFRQENNRWLFSKAGELPVEASAPASASSSSGESTSSTPAQPPPEIENNDVLKRLMELRQKENQ
jgi:hypothetical protein